MRKGDNDNEKSHFDDIYLKIGISMRKEGKKYILRESELADLIIGTILLESSATSISQAAYTPRGRGQNPIQVKDVTKALGGALGSVPEALFPGSTEKVMSGNNPLLRGLYNLLGANGAAAAPDFIRNYLRGQGRGEGQNPDAHQVFNVNAAAAWLKNNAQPTYNKATSGWCARYVRIAMNQGGLEAPWGMPAGDAKDYLTILPKNGWDLIALGTPPEVGDVCVIAAHPGHPHGHIAMYIGRGVWASDFIQGSMHGLKTPPPAGTVHLFRYRNRA